MTDLLKNPIFLNETAAREWLEARVWAKVGSARIAASGSGQVTKLEGKAHVPACTSATNECRQQFTVTVEYCIRASEFPLTKWLAALFLMTASKKGISAHQVHRMLGHQLQIDVVPNASPARGYARWWPIAADGRSWRRGR